ncbi:SNF2-family ATP dependent chromatin remodeling factor snf21 [Armillaria borealis]|uniref:SNF2-family ATP dependent chromatin remodeling factor snf21 n=1 Tax=Armillaria borealis TaxID=47425 RepID=A0AA39K957_9AGAR|nr:SNF2-family ATP dependent chromatin remodeling factor snf21 [Armillaria borealis]
MSAPMLANGLPQNIPPHHGLRQPAMQELQQLILRVNFLRKNPTEQKSPNELENLVKYIQNVSNQTRNHAQAAQQQQTQQSLVNGNGITNGSTPVVVPPAPPHTPVSFTSDQINVLRAQISAFKLLSRHLPVPDNVQQAMQMHNAVAVADEKRLQSPDSTSRAADSAVKVPKGESGTPALDIGKSEEPEEIEIDPADLPKGPFLEDDVNSGIYPYNAYRHPFSHLKCGPETDKALFSTRLQRLLVPTIMPTGLDANQILAERDLFIENRIQQRIRELEALPSTMGDGGLVPGVDIDEMVKGEKENTVANDAHLGTLIHPSATSHGKFRAMIELKSLRLVEKQRAMRALVAERLTHGSLLPLNRVDFKRTRKPHPKDARMTEQLERRQRTDRERRAKHKHVEQLNVITAHGRELIAVNRAAQERVLRIGRAVLSYHVHTEKEEQKRIERISKERLKALKADDEEAYMKLIDTAKDTRITHLLRQTDAYLDSLAQAVVAQQNEGGPQEHFQFEVEDGPATEATFGAQVTEEVNEDKTKVDYYAVAHRISEKVTRQPLILVGGTLKEYQLKGLQWMVSLYNNRLNGILADEMGLGKTIQTISLISFLIEVKRQRGPYLVIVPLSTMTNWSGEFAKWAPSIKMVSYKGNPAQRRALQGDLRVGQFQVLLTTYEYIIKDRPHLSKLKWLHMIIDEGHRMKNTQSKLSQTLTTYYHTRYRLILTGTPLQNNLPELWSLLNFVLPKIFNSVKSFDEWFNTPFANSGTGDKIELNEEEALLIIRRLHKVLRPFLLRRLKKDVESELPDKVEKVIKVRMSALQSQLYKQMKKHKMIADGKDAKGKSGGVKGLSNELMQLRKICQHPFLFESVEDKVNPSQVIDDKLVRTSGKIELLSRVLPKFFAADHRVLVFFQMTKVMDIMEDFLKMMGWKYLRLDGGTKTEERASYVQMFNAKDSEYKVFILSTRAGGLGLNLQTADTVIIFDSDWNPHADLQAQDRAHRIGQTRAVLILRFITEKSVEEAMYQRARYKLDIDDKVIQAGRFDNKSTQEEQEEFLRSILEADQEEENEEAGDMNDEELNALIARSEEEGEVFRQMDTVRERESQESWRKQGKRGKAPPPLIQIEELPECYQTDEPFETKDTEEIFEGRGQRRRNVVSYNDGLSDDAWARALEDGEDLDDISERPRKTRNVAKFIREGEASSRGTPVSDLDSRPRKGRKGKAKAQDYDAPIGSKRKRGIKAMSVTPSAAGDDEDEDRISKRRKTKTSDISPALRERMKRAFEECYDAVYDCEAEEGRTRRDLFLQLPAKKTYPDYYQLISRPICMSQIQKRSQSSYYKTVQQFRDDWKLMFNNARTYNQEGSWVYNDAEEMEKVFDAVYERAIVGSGLPGAPSSGPYDDALTPMDDDERPPPPVRSRSTGRKQVISDEEADDPEYLTPSDDD